MAIKKRIITVEKDNYLRSQEVHAIEKVEKFENSNFESVATLTNGSKHRVKMGLGNFMKFLKNKRVNTLG